MHKASTLQLVLVVLWLVVALISLSLMTHTQSKRQKLGDLMFFCLLGSGFSLALCSVLCPEVQSLLS